MVQAVSKPFTEEELSTQIASDRTWRVREISDLKYAIRNADVVGQRVLLRALVTIAYAHWEGHVRFASYKYLSHIAMRKLPLAILEDQFVRNHFYSQLGFVLKGSLKEKGKLIDRVLAASSIRFSKVNEDILSTKSNLSFEVLSDICLVCGLSISLFENDATFIDSILLKRRNSIAHGQDTFVDLDDLDVVSDRTISLMRRFGDELANRAALRLYRASPTS